jgi:AcrR family transcriptional regulator
VPRSADLTVRVTLIERAAELLAAREPVTLRGLAAAAGTSTMAVYTHFGGMPGLWAAVRAEGFTRLARRLATQRPSDDPVTDLTLVGSVYVANALADPNLYLTMFDNRYELDDPGVAATGFEVLVGAAARARAEGRFAETVDPAAAATRLWGMTHGMVMLVLTGALERSDLGRHLPPMWAAAYVGFGDRMASAQRSAEAGWVEPG